MRLVRRHRQDDGIAMITAILVSFVILMLSVTAAALSVHNTNESGLDRKRLQVIDAAEAGIDSTLTLIKALPTSQLPCTVTGTLAVTPQQQYNVTVSYFDQNNGTLTCSTSTGVAGTPYRAVLVSKGSSLPSAVTPTGTRTMESEVRLSATYGSLNQAIFSNNTPTIANNSVINGYQGNDANIYTNGDFACSNSVSDHGSVYAQGGANLNQTCSVNGDFWAKNAVAMSNNSIVQGNVKSATSGITLSNSATINGTASAFTTVTVNGTNAHINGSPPIVNGWNGGPPPALNFTHIVYDLTTVEPAWVAKGYTIQTFSDCTQAATFIKGLGSTSPKTLVHITGNCTLSLSGGSVSLYNDLAVVSDVGPIAPASITIQSGDGTVHLLQFIVAWSTTTSAACGTSSSPDYNESNQTTISNLDLFVYTPCTINIYNNAGAGGQLYGGTVNIKNQFTMNYIPFDIPGAGGISGYNAEVAYKREIVNPSS